MAIARATPASPRRWAGEIDFKIDLGRISAYEAITPSI
jgi:hypothetical protein